jgi:protease IV
MASIRGFLLGVWRFLDGLRRALQLLVMLVVCVVLVGLLRKSVPSMPHDGALVLHPAGQIVEQLSGNPVQRAFDEASGQSQAQTLLWDLTEGIDAATADKRVTALVLELDSFEGAGQPILEELSASLAKFKQSGKKLIARGSSYSQAQYYLAAQADEIYLDPDGMVLIEGYERYGIYFKGALDKLSVDVHLFRVGKFKSAAEPYVRSDMSPEDREETLSYLNGLWSGYRSAVAAARGLQPEALQTYADNFATQIQKQNGDTAQMALDAGLVTALKTDDEIDQRLIELVGENSDDHYYRAIDFDHYLRVVQAEATLHHKNNDRIDVIIASGEILDGEQDPGLVGGRSTAKLLREARLDDKTKAVVLRIDSPGGSVFASEQIYREVVALRAAGKPVVASMGDVAASGGYYIAAPADQIFSSATTITGSIGIFAVFPTVDRAMGRLGLTVDGVGTTALSGKMRIDRPLDDVTAKVVQSSINRGYEQFLAHVAEGRDKTRDEVHEVAQGRVWIGSDAQRLGLVDTLGGYADAVAAAAKLAELPEGSYSVERVEPELDWAGELAMRMNTHLARLSGRLLGKSMQGWSGLLAQLSPVQAGLMRLQQSAKPGQAYAYCYCKVQ